MAKSFKHHLNSSWLTLHWYPLHLSFIDDFPNPIPIFHVSPPFFSVQHGSTPRGSCRFAPRSSADASPARPQPWPWRCPSCPSCRRGCRRSCRSTFAWTWGPQGYHGSLAMNFDGIELIIIYCSWCNWCNHETWRMMLGGSTWVSEPHDFGAPFQVST